jgi:hypothetical protein
LRAAKAGLASTPAVSVAHASSGPSRRADERRGERVWAEKVVIGRQQAQQSRGPFDLV